MSSDFDENLDKSLFKTPEEYVQATCFGKVIDIKKKIANEKIPYDLLIFCDTICYCQNKIIEKPSDSAEAFQILRLFSGNKHMIYTSLHLILREKEEEIEHGIVVSTEVEFDQIPEESMLSYSQSDYYKNKAGGYGIQDIGESFIKKINGSYSNVVGLPLNEFCKSLIYLMKKAKWIM